MLIEMRKYLKEHGDASLIELCQQFHVEDPEVMRNMLADLIAKGEVRLKQSAGEVTCTKCAQCRILANEIYEWTGKC
jgi:hypothetical protein